MSRRERLVLGVIFVAALAIRLSVWGRVFRQGQILLDGPDAYYHLRRAALTLQHWPWVAQTDALLNVPVGGVISWPPLFDLLLATLSLPWPHALELIGAFLPPLLGLAEIAMLYLVMARLASRRAAMASALVAAVLPAVVRYTLLGSLDHDPFFELSVLIALNGLVRRGPVMLATGLILAVLCWGGSLVAVGLIAWIGAAVALSSKQNAAAVGMVISSAATGAAIVAVPFVLRSEWTLQERFSFEGLSLLQETGLIALAFGGAVLAILTGAPRRRFHSLLAALSGVALIFLLPGSLRSFLQGVRYAAGDAPILELVAEARPLLFLLGPFDLRPLLVRLGLLPLVFVILTAVWFVRRYAREQTLLLAGWGAATLALALLHSRFSFSAAIALSAFAGAGWDYIAQRRDFRPAAAGAAAALILLPALAAYIPIPGWEAHNFYVREIALERYEMTRVGRVLRAQPEPGAVIAPWYLGHWVLWFSGRGVVLSPMLSVGQSEFQDGMRFFFLEDPADATLFLRAHRVRYLVVTPELGSISTRARISGLDPGRYLTVDPNSGETMLNLPAYMRTVAARLTFWGPLEGYEELMRSSSMVQGPFGPVPLVRIYRTE